MKKESKKNLDAKLRIAHPIEKGDRYLYRSPFLLAISEMTVLRKNFLLILFFSKKRMITVPQQ